MGENRKDLVARLLNTGTLNGQTWPELTAEAAAEITALRAALGELEGALRYIAGAPLSGWTIAQAIARQALRRSDDDG